MQLLELGQLGNKSETLLSGKNPSLPVTQARWIVKVTNKHKDVHLSCAQSLPHFWPPLGWEAHPHKVKSQLDVHCYLFPADWPNKRNFYILNVLTNSLFLLASNIPSDDIHVWCETNIWTNDWEKSSPLANPFLLNSHLQLTLPDSIKLSAINLHKTQDSHQDIYSEWHMTCNLKAVKYNLTELTTRSTSFTSEVSGLLDMHVCQDSLCSCTLGHCSSWLAF